MNERRVQLCDLAPTHAALRAEIFDAIERVYDSGQYVLGPDVAAFEGEIANYLGARFAIGVSSGSDALLASLMALGISAGDEVVTTPFTFFATAGAIARLGARPVFVDIDAETFNLDPERLEAALSPKTRAIVPVHLYGQPCPMSTLLEIANRRSIPVVEDAAQAMGARYRSHARVGTLGALGCFSFFPSKNLGGIGDGGIVVTNDEALAARVRRLRQHGCERKYIHSEVGGNFRIDTLQAAILRVKLKHVDDWNAARRDVAERYDRLFEGAVGAGRLQAGKVMPPRERESGHVYHQYVIRAQQRDALAQHLTTRGVSTAVYYPVPLHLQEALQPLGYKAGDLPVAEAAARDVLALPMYPQLSESDQKYVVDAIAQFYANS